MSGLPTNPDTKILTRQGWKNYQDYVSGELKEGEDVYTYEPLSKTFKWEPLISIVSHPIGSMVGVTLETTVVNNKGITLIMGDKVPWIVEVVQRGNRRYTGYDGVKLRELDKVRSGIGEKKHSSDMGTTYYLILGEGDNLVTHQENDSRIDMTNVIVGGSTSQASWTPYNSNETIVVQQNGIIFCVGTLSLRDGISSYSVNSSNVLSIPKALDAYVLVENKAVRLREFSGFSPLLNVEIKDVVISVIPPTNEGILYYQGNPVTSVPLTLPLEEAQKLIYIPDRLFLGISIIEYDVIDANGSVSTTPGTIEITSANSVVVWQATEATLYEVKLLLEDLPNKVLQTNVNNFPTDYSRELTLGNVDTTLKSFPNNTWDTNVVNIPNDYAKELTLSNIDTALNSFPTKVWDTKVVNIPGDYTKEVTLETLRQLVNDLPSKTLQANVNNFPTNYATEPTLLALRQLLNDLPTKVLQANINNLPTNYSTEPTLQSLGVKLDSIRNFISTPTSLTLTNSLLVGAGSIDAGFYYMSMFVVQGPVVIGGRTYNTNDDIVFHPIPFKVYPAISYNMAIGSVRFTGFK